MKVARQILCLGIVGTGRLFMGSLIEDSAICHGNQYIVYNGGVLLIQSELIDTCHQWNVIINHQTCFIFIAVPFLLRSSEYCAGNMHIRNGPRYFSISWRLVLALSTYIRQVICFTVMETITVFSRSNISRLMWWTFQYFIYFRRMCHLNVNRLEVAKCP